MATTTKITAAKKQSLATMTKRIANGSAPAVFGALNGLVGCPEGGWAKTAQAKRALYDEVPRRAERSYTFYDLVDAVLTVDHAGRYQWRA
jgi:hypothetical protein